MRALFLTLALAFAVPAFAEDPAEAPAQPAAAGGEVRKWLVYLKKILADSSVRHQSRRMKGAVTVAAVRGSGQGLDDPAKPYWKGTAESKQDREARRERMELGRAADLALEGKVDEALKVLDAFEAAYPNSALLTDCRAAREKLAAAKASGELTAPDTLSRGAGEGKGEGSQAPPPVAPAQAAAVEAPAQAAAVEAPAQAAATATPAPASPPAEAPAAKPSQPPLADEVPPKGGDQ